MIKNNISLQKADEKGKGGQHITTNMKQSGQGHRKTQEAMHRQNNQSLMLPLTSKK